MDSSTLISFLPFSIFFMLLIPSLSATTACDRCQHNTKVAFFSSDSPTPHGACGYGSLATSFSNGMVAGATPSIYNSGAACGSCFQISCKNATLCRKQGTKVIVTDLNGDPNKGFVLAKKAFMAMANTGKEGHILKMGIVDVQYKRIPCEYKNKNLTVNVDENSHNPSYLAIKFIYQGGQTEIVGVEIAKVGSANWSAMKRRGNDAVWVTYRLPKGALQLRMMVIAGYDRKWISAKSSVLPGNWKPGFNYDLGIQITDVMQERCSSCNVEQI